MPSLPTPEFSRPVRPDSHATTPDLPIEGTADSDECMALARRFDVPRVLSLSFRIKLSPFGVGGWRLSGEAAATLEQLCVVTLEPIETEVIETIDRRFVPGDTLPNFAPGSETELDAEMTDGPDGYDGVIDLGEVAAEAIALGIDPYPRRPDADDVRIIAGPSGVAAMTDEAARPFAGLAILKTRPEDG